MIVQEIMSAPVHVVTTQENIAYARNLMLRHKISRLLVMDEEKLVGIITKKDIAYGFRQHDPIWRRRPIDRIPVEVMMQKDPITVSPDLQVGKAVGMMLTHDISGLPVMGSENIEGIITKSDIMASGEADRITATVGDIMEDVLTVSRYHSLNHIIDLIRERNDKILVINNDGTLAGVITESNIAFYEFFDHDGVPERDITHLRKEESGGAKNRRHVRQLSGVAEDLMSRPVITINPAESISSAIALMRKHHINSIIAEEAGEIKGILKRDDILKEVAQ